MQEFEIYIMLFFDQMSGTFLLPIHYPYIFKCMIYSGNFNTLTAYMVALPASVIGILGDWCLGKIFSSIKKAEHDEALKNQKLKTKTKIKDILPFFLIFIAPFTPFGGILAFFSGIVSSKMSYVLICFAISEALYLLYTVYTGLSSSI